MMKSLKFGTTIVAISNNSELIIVADSKIHNHGSTEAKPLCKVYQFGDVVFCHAGVMSYDNLSIGEIVKDIFNSNLRSFEENLNIVKSSISKALLPLFQQFYDNERDNFDTHLLNKPIVQMLFSFCLNGTPHVYLKIFIPVLQEGKVLFGLHEDNATCSIDVYLGHFDNITQYISSNKNYKLDKDTITVAKELIELEIEANPDKVGKPLTVVKINSAGVDWIEAGICQFDA